jgi:hypothetical protein
MNSWIQVYSYPYVCKINIQRKETKLEAREVRPHHTLPTRRDGITCTVLVGPILSPPGEEKGREREKGKEKEKGKRKG